MLYEAAYWHSERPRPPLEEGLVSPPLAKLLENWGAPGDAGVIAVSPDGVPVGAAWYRFWTDEDHSFGYVRSEAPELGIAVAPEHRGRGIGGALLVALLRLAAAHGVADLSLSVEVANPARHLYLRNGFRIVEDLGNTWTMLAASAESSNYSNTDSQSSA